MSDALKTTTRFSKKKRLPVWLALFALVMQTMVPLGQVLHAAESTATVFICTPSGVVPTDAGDVDGQAELDMSACQVCQVRLFGQGVETPSSALPIPTIVTEAAKVADASSSVAGNTFTGPLPPRGPPTFS